MAQSARKLNQSDEDRRDDAMAIITAPGWQPKAGDRLRGVCVASRAQDSEWENPDGKLYYPVFTFKLDDSNEYVTVHCFHSLLYKEAKRHQIKVGFHGEIFHGGEQLKASARKAGKTLETAGPKDKYVHYAVVDLDNPEPTSSFEWGTNADDGPDF
jgi:hypothetical protein